MGFFIALGIIGLILSGGMTNMGSGKK